MLLGSKCHLDVVKKGRRSRKHKLIKDKFKQVGLTLVTKSLIPSKLINTPDEVSKAILNPLEEKTTCESPEEENLEISDPEALIFETS